MLVKRATVIFDPNDVAMPLAERVVHLVNHRDERGICSVAEEYAQRIEAIAERARHAEQVNPAASNIDARLTRAGVRPGFEAALRCRRRGRRHKD